MVQAGGGQELVEELLQLLALPVGNPEQLLLLEKRQRLGVLVQGCQGAEQCRQRLA